MIKSSCNMFVEYLDGIRPSDHMLVVMLRSRARYVNISQYSHMTAE